MANRKETTAYSNYAFVDTDPGVEGFFTEASAAARASLIAKGYSLMISA